MKPTARAVPRLCTCDHLPSITEGRKRNLLPPSKREATATVWAPTGFVKESENKYTTPDGICQEGTNRNQTLHGLGYPAR